VRLGVVDTDLKLLRASLDHVSTLLAEYQAQCPSPVPLSNLVMVGPGRCLLSYCIHGRSSCIYLYVPMHIFGHSMDILDECDATHCTVPIYNIYAIKLAQFHCVRVAL
jgi:hypothetical protein